MVFFAMFFDYKSANMNSWLWIWWIHISCDSIYNDFSLNIGYFRSIFAVLIISRIDLMSWLIQLIYYRNFDWIKHLSIRWNTSMFKLISEEFWTIDHSFSAIDNSSIYLVYYTANSTSYNMSCLYTISLKKLAF